MLKRIFAVVLLVLFATPVLAAGRIWLPETKVTLTCPANGASTATTLEGKNSFTFFAYGERTCLCIGQTVCDNTAAKGGICIEQGAAVDFGISGARPVSCWSLNGLGTADILGWR